jgi:hypothetical protein
VVGQAATDPPVFTRRADPPGDPARDQSPADDVGLNSVGEGVGDERDRFAAG